MPLKKSAVVTNIQRFSVHDGPGIRTTVFFKGCPLSCLWCHNPEAMGFEADGNSKTYTAEELLKIIVRDRLFFEQDGGLTLSGGEPLAQDMAFVTEFLALVKKHDINVACDTCGDVPWENFQAVMPYVDLFLYDIKLATESAHIKYTGKSNKRVIKNLENLTKFSNVEIRIPVIGGANDGKEMQEIQKLVKKIAPLSPVKYIPYHKLGIGKWEKMGLRPHVFSAPTDEYMESIFRTGRRKENHFSARLEVAPDGKLQKDFGRCFPS